MILALVLALTTLSREPVSVKSLLPQMIDLEQLSRRPNPSYTLGQASSYDRASNDLRNEEAWYANGDYGQFVRTETIDGRIESVLADLKGPGAVVRIWSANPKGRIRFYFDGETRPRFSEKMGELLSGQVSGLQIEVLPGVMGFLHVGSFGNAASSRMGSLKRGNLLTVEIEEPASASNRDVRLRLPTQVFAVGQSVRGTVVGFAKDTRGYGTPSAFIELAPGVEGELFHKNAPRNYIKTLRQGQTVMVRILGPRHNGRDGYELSC